MTRLKQRGSIAVARALEAEGVRFAFGIPGTHNIELYDALDERGAVTPVLVTDEQSASFMADGLARSTGAVGVVNLVPGAGVTHALSGIAEAWMDNVPLLVLACGVRDDTGRAYQLHDVDQAALLAPVTKAVLQPAHPRDLAATIHRACALARSGAPGPVAVLVPANHYLLTHEVGEGDLAARLHTAAPRDPDPAALTEAARQIAAAARPALYVGAGATATGAALVRLAEALAAPVATTIQGKGVFPESHPLWLWNGFGRAAPPFVRELMDRADLVLAIGCRFGEVGTASWGMDPPANLVHVDVDPGVFHRNFPARLAIESDASRFVDALLARVTPRPRRADLEAGIARGHAAVHDARVKPASAERVTPARLFEALSAASPDAIWVTDSGNGTFLAMEHLRLDAPRRFLAPVDYSCMGYCVPAAIGAKLANPGREVIALAGDGALLMTGLEMLTARAYGASPLVVVLRDGELGQIAQFQKLFLNRSTCSRVPHYALADLARAVGAEHVNLACDAALETALPHALERSRAGHPVVVEAHVDYSVKTYFTWGAFATTMLRLPLGDRLRLAGRAAGRYLEGLLPGRAAPRARGA